MPPVGRVVLGALAVFMVWTLVRALRGGTIFSQGSAFDINDQPMLFSLTAAVHVAGAAFFAWLAAGGDIAGFWRLVAPH